VSQPVRLIHVMTVPESLLFLRGQAGFMRTRGIETQAIASPGELLARFAADERVETAAVPMARRITPLADLLSLVRLARELRRRQPDIVHAHTPKGGLLGMIAAFLAGVPVRIYHLHTLAFVTASGSRRFLLRATERVSCALAHHVLCVSRSLREIAVAENLCAPGKVSVLLGGSINGVDALERFNPAHHAGARQATRARLGIPQDAVVVGFVGRLVREKGIAELARAFQLLRDELPSLHLLLVGPFEPQDPVDPVTRRQLAEDPRVHQVGLDWDTPPYYAAIDLLALPTWREGFGLVLIEAAAMSLPVVATRIPGCVDAVEEGVTGVLVPPRDPEALAAAVRGYLADPVRARAHGEAGRARALRDFQQEKMWEALEGAYRSLLSERGAAAGPGPPAVPGRL
jgi:glycosyltransferase involved in cell wall biosynthesis